MEPSHDRHRSWARKRIVPSACRVRLDDGPWCWGILQDLSPAGAGLRLYGTGGELPAKYTRGMLNMGSRRYTFAVAWAKPDLGLGPKAGSVRLGVRFDQPNVEVFQRKDLTDAEIHSRWLVFEARGSSDPPVLHAAMERLSALANAVDAAAEMLLVLSSAECPERFAVFEPRLRFVESHPALKGSLEIARDAAAVLEPAEALWARRAAAAKDPSGDDSPSGPFRLSAEEIEIYRGHLGEGLDGWPIPTDAFAEGSQERRVLEERLFPALERLGRGSGGLRLSVAETQ